MYGSRIFFVSVIKKCKLNLTLSMKADEKGRGRPEPIEGRKIQSRVDAIKKRMREKEDKSWSKHESE